VDYDNRLTTVSGAATATYKYDYQGRRTGKTVGASSAYVYDGLNLVQETGASPADYLFGPGIDVPLAMSRGGQGYFFVTDAIGSVVAITNSVGSVQNTYLNDAWGQMRSQTGSLANPFGYTAREMGEAGSLFYRFRYYSPGIGRFLAEDPLVSAVPVTYATGLLSRPLEFPPYAYARNGPIARTDPLGLDVCQPFPDPNLDCVLRCQRSLSLNIGACSVGFSAASLACAIGASKCMITGQWYACAAYFAICEGAAYLAYRYCVAAAMDAYVNCLRGCNKK